VGEAEGEANEEVAETEEVAGTEEVAEAGGRGKCKGMNTWPLHESYFFHCRDRP